MAFSKLKALLRKAATRTIDELWSVVANCLAAFTAEECRHYFEAAGYDPEYVESALAAQEGQDGRTTSYATRLLLIRRTGEGRERN
ncbi:hypothetical protein [Mesorhizobium caraganae]|uniref:hypothetical protein n=1 Tax=Mesorhizobium caraganae TaxID=483206 RepID=UPI003F509113